MNKINFQNLPSQTTPVNASNLNQLQTNVETELNSILDTAQFMNYTTNLTTSDTQKAIMEDVLSHVSTAGKDYIIDCRFSGGGTSFLTIARKSSSNAGFALVIGTGTPFKGVRHVWLNSGTAIITSIYGAETGIITASGGMTKSSNTYLKKQNNIVDLYYQCSGASISADTSTTIGTIPEGFRPSSLIIVPALFNYGFSASGGTQYNAMVQINTSGDIIMLSHNAVGSSHSIRIKATYLID